MPTPSATPSPSDSATPHRAAPAAFDAEGALALLAKHRATRLDSTFLHAISTSRKVALGATGGTKRKLPVTLEDASDYDDNERANTSGDGSDSRETPARTASQPKKRIPTHVLRKEEKEQVLKELQQLESRAAFLRQAHGLEDPKVIKAKLELNANLREAILQRDLVIASTQSAISGFAISRVTSPIETYIHLTKDWDQRREALLAMKDQKIHDAHRFLTERTRHMNPFKSACEVSQFESDNGDLCVLKIDVTPFEGVKSVRQVFEAMQFYFFNVEISITEMSGNVTIRENDDSTEKSVLHHRLVVSQPSGVLLEKNAVCFMDSSGLEAENVDDQWAIAVGDFVDRDDRYPYCPHERLRKDSTSVMKLSAYHRRRSAASKQGESSEVASRDHEDADDSELVVVLTRWYLCRIRRPEFAIPKHVLQAISNDQSSGIDIILQSMRQGMFPSTAPWTTE